MANKRGRPKGSRKKEPIMVQMAVGVEVQTRDYIKRIAPHGQSEWIRKAILQRIKRENEK